MPLTDKDVQVLSREYPRPSERPAFSPANWSLDGGEKVPVNVVSDRATWVLVNRPFKLTELVTNLTSFARDIARAVRAYVS